MSFKTIGMFILAVVFAVACIGLVAGCAPQQAYSSADALGRTSSIAGSASIDARKTADQTGKARTRMVRDIDSIKEAEKLFDEQSGITVSY